MSLLATGHLGENTWPWLEDLTADLRADGVDIIVDRTIALVEADLLFACGLLTRVLIDSGHDLTVFAAPIFPGETVATYRSVIITRAAEETADLVILSRKRLAFNEYESWSGWHAYCHHLQARGRQPNRDRIETGSHHASMRAVAEGRADVAAIDSSLWRHFLDDPLRAEVVGVATTDDWPAPPLSLSGRIDAPTQRLIVERVRARPEFVAAHASTYDRMVRLSESSDREH